MGKRLKEPMQILMEKVARGPNNCWEWQRTLDKKGYGKMSSRTNGKNFWLLSHRYSYQIWNGPIPKGMHVCHRCDNPLCANPDHLFLGTPKINFDDMVSKGRWPLIDTRNPRWKLSPSLAVEIYKSTEDYAVLAKRYGVKRHSIYCIKHGQTWRKATSSIGDRREGT